MNAEDDWKLKLRNAYDKIKSHGDRFAWPGLIGDLSTSFDPTIKSIQCVGNHNSEKKSAFPRMHNKFLVFSNFVEHNKPLPEGYSITLENKEVWTGS